MCAALRGAARSMYGHLLRRQLLESRWRLPWRGNNPTRPHFANLPTPWARTAAPWTGPVGTAGDRGCARTNRGVFVWRVTAPPYLPGCAK